MKRSVLLSILILSLIFIPLVIADEEGDKVDKAYNCLTNKVNESCSSLSSEEKIFSLLAIGECKEEVISDSENNECWPSSGCTIKTTAQAILALDNVNSNVEEAKSWLLSQNTIPADIDWYLEIESTDATTCTIVYSNNSYSIEIGADKKINTKAGNCLSLSETPYADYWLKISPNCYDNEFEISCDKSFLTTLLYKRVNSPTTIYVSDKMSSASEGGITTEKVDFSCFKQGNTCDYEGSLWAAFVLDSLGEDISKYLPYLITMVEDNPQYIPESFLYLIDPSDTASRTTLLSEQQSSKWWSVSGDKYYDTALALLGFQNENPQEKINSKDWLLEVQDSEGCWQGNVRNTAFILYSIWPKDIGGVGDGTSPLNCEDVDGYCVFETSCTDIGGSELSAYSFSCSGTKICCDTSPYLETCEEIGGEICASDETCSISTTETLDTYDCCTGYCEEVVIVQSECVIGGGSCKDTCLSDEEENSDDCDYPGEVCCVDKGEPEPTASYWWIWVLLILIVLIVMGIIFRDKLRHFWLRIKSKFKKKPKTPPGHPLIKTNMRRPLHKMVSPSRRPLPSRRPKSEVDDVLKKLKEIGK